MKIYHKVILLSAFQLLLSVACGGSGTGHSSAAVPRVLFTTPIDAGLGVFTNYNVIAANFSDAMDPATVNTETFKVNQGSTVIAGTVTLMGSIATFRTTSDLAPNRIYTATITTGAKNTSGVPLAANKTWYFTSGPGPSTALPLVIATLPATAATGIATNQTVIAAAFNQVLDPLTVNTNTFTLMQGTTAIPGRVSWFGRIATFRANANLASNTAYTATITAGAKDIAGNSLGADYTWTFTTGDAPASPDVTAPTVLTVNPGDRQDGVARNVTIVSTFSKPMDPTSFLIDRPGSVVPASGGTPIRGTVTWDPSGRAVSFTPTSALLANTAYVATITTAAKDTAGNPLAANRVWTFTTGAGFAPSVLQPKVDTRQAAQFAILADSAITDTSNTAQIGGSIGVVTGRGSLIGTKCSELFAGIGNFIYPSDTTATGGACVKNEPKTLNQVQTDANSAFATASGRSGSARVIANELNGQMLFPGPYAAPGNITFADGGFLYFDALNDPNAVFIIFGTGMTTGAGSTVVLLGGAKASNIFWVIGSTSAVSSISLGDNSYMKGTLMSPGGAITLGAGSNLVGRAWTLGSGGTVTVKNNVIVTVPVL